MCSFLFLPHFFFILFAYGTIPGLFFVVLGLWLMLCYEQADGGRGYIWGILSALSLAIAVQLKKNYILAVVALVLYLMIQLCGQRGRVKRTVLYIGVLLLTVIGSGRLLLSCYARMNGAPVPAGEPTISYIAMGLMDQKEDSARPAGWYNGYVWEVYEEADCDAAEASRLSMELIKARISDFKTDPLYAIRFFCGKVRSTWAEPLFQSVWSGPLEDEGQTVNGIILQNLYRGNRVYLLAELWMHVLNVLLYVGCVIAVMKTLFGNGKSMPKLYLFYLIYFLGGFWYHLISETKAQYVYMYLFLLIPCAMAAYDSLSCKDSKNEAS